LWIWLSRVQIPSVTPSLQPTLIIDRLRKPRHFAGDVFHLVLEKLKKAVKYQRILPAMALLFLAGRFDTATAQIQTILHNFSGGADGGKSFARLVQGSDGNFYGTTGTGGTNGAGVVFQMNSAGTVTTLHNFTGGADGRHSSFGGALIQGSDGDFYGTAYEGGTYNTGTVFKISSAGILTSLHQFSGPDGGGPEAGLVEGSDGNFYGTTYWGGTNDHGTVYKISSGGAFTNLYQFSGADGSHPYTGLVQGSDGFFYGTTHNGGTNGWGTVFQFNSAGTLSTIHHFRGAADGANPYGPLVQGNDGYLYGTTFTWGPSGGGTAFKISPSGAFTNLYEFSGGGGPNGRGPQCGLVQGSDGNFYGTTFWGGMTNSVYPLGAGIVFMITPAGDLTPAYQFSGQDGANPFAGLVQGSDGNFYGTTGSGGVYNQGTIFRLSVLLNLPANQISVIQVADTNIVITIPSVATETYQLQYRDSLTDGDWSDILGASKKSIGGSLSLTNLGGALQPQRFYRAVHIP
jgi:uncharacterized repeat protein (TIGR03803 family)